MCACAIGVYLCMCVCIFVALYSLASNVCTWENVENAHLRAVCTVWVYVFVGLNLRRTTFSCR